MIRPTTIFTLVVLSILVVQIECQYNDYGYSARNIFRAPKALTDFVRRIFGRRRHQGFQGTAQTNLPYTMEASNYPNSNVYQMQSGYGGQYNQVGYNPSMASSQSYVTYDPKSPSPNASPDFHSVLDQFVRSTGVSPAGAGDQVPAASNSDQPVFSFKKLYSFPFYLSTDSQSADGYRLRIPYMKRHIRRRMSIADNDESKAGFQLILDGDRQAQLEAARQHLISQQQLALRSSVDNPQSLVNRFIEQQLIGEQKILNHSQNNGKSTPKTAEQNDENMVKNQLPISYY